MSVELEPLSRIQRKEKKQRRQLRCEWCNKYTHVTKRLWNEVARDERERYQDPPTIMWNKSQVIFCCDRERCMAHRPSEWLPSEVTGLVWMKSAQKEKEIYIG